MKKAIKTIVLVVLLVSTAAFIYGSIKSVQQTRHNFELLRGENK